MVIAVLPAAIFVLARVAVRANDTDAIFIQWLIRGLLLGWAAAVGGLIWSVFDERRREQVWQNARLAPDDPRLHSPPTPPDPEDGGRQTDWPSE